MAKSESPANWQPRFWAIFAGQAASMLGSALVQFALIWWLTLRSGSATTLAIAAVFGLLPGVLIGPFAGVIIDRYNRRVIMILADAAVALATLGLLLLFWFDAVQIWHVYVALLLRALGSTFHGPAMSATVPLLAPADQLTRINGWTQALQGAIGVIAPALGALLVSVGPIAGVLSIDVITALVAILPLLLFSIPSAHVAPVAGLSMWGDLRAGLAYVRGQPGILQLMLLSLLLNMILVPAGALLPLLINREFGAGPALFAAAEMGFGVGIIAGGVLLGVWGGFKRRLLTSALGVLGLALGGALIGFAPRSLGVLVIAGQAIFGLSVPLANGPAFALMQQIVPSDKFGRVGALIGSASLAVTPLSLAIAGPFSDYAGLRIWYVLGALMCIAAAAFVNVSPALNALEKTAGIPNSEFGIPT
jgi:MFS transporter, DHA3 family, macrolide efflux protein